MTIIKPPNNLHTEKHQCEYYLANETGAECEKDAVVLAGVPALAYKQLYLCSDHLTTHGTGFLDAITNITDTPIQLEKVLYKGWKVVD